MIDIASGELSGGRPAGKTLWRAAGLVPSETPLYRLWKIATVKAPWRPLFL
jgi:hypothetical protein